VGPRAVLDAAVKRKIPSPAGNQFLIPLIHAFTAEKEIMLDQVSEQQF
jgi:hypothetical protein